MVDDLKIAVYSTSVEDRVARRLCSFAHLIQWADKIACG